MPDSKSACLARCIALTISLDAVAARAGEASPGALAEDAAPSAAAPNATNGGAAAESGAVDAGNPGAAASGGAAAAVLAEVEVSVIGDTGPPIAEAVLRIQAELRSVGFGVQPASNSPPALGAPESARRKVGTIVLVRSGDSVQILAQAADGAPLTQQVDLTRASITAEVLAVRAVEALRAVLLQSMRDRTAPPESVTDTVRAFTQSSERPPVAPAPPSPPPAPAPARPPPAPAKPEETPWLLAAGPMLLAPALGASVTAGAEAQLARTFGPLFVGVVVDGSIVPARWSTQKGTVEVSQRSLLAVVGSALPCPPPFMCQLGAGLGPRWSSVVALPDDPAAPAETARHESLLAEGDVLIGYFFDEHAGIVARARVGSLLDAPAMTAAREESVSWGRPAWGTSLCAALRF